jgi:PAS domain S-box-containing protein
MKTLSNRKKYSLIGFLFGLGFPIFSTIFQLIISGLEVSFGNIVLIQTEMKLLWVIDTAPFMLGIFSFLGGMKQDEIENYQLKFKDIYTNLETKFQAVFKDGDFGILIFNWQRQTFDDINPGFLRMIGYTLEEVKELGFEKITFPEDIAEERKIFKRILKTQGNFTFEKRFIHKDGRLIWCKLTYSVIRGKDSHIQYIFTLVDDITKEKMAQEELVSQQKFIRQVIDLIPDLIFVKDKEGRLILVNEAMAKTFNKSISEIENKLNSEIHSNKDEVKQYSSIDKLVLERNYMITQEENFTKEDGSIRIYKTTKMPIRNSDNTRFVLAFAKDITDEIEYQNNLIKLKETAEQTSKMKSEFLANMSHEIRTPLNGILGMSAILSETKLDAEQKEVVETIITSGDSLLIILNDILDYSKIEAGKIEFEHSEFNIAKCIQDVQNLFLYKAKEKGLDLLVEIDPLIPEFLIGDHFRIRQILINLIGNSLKFTSKGSIQIKLNFIAKNFDKREIQFQIIDTGIGIEEEKIGRLFQSFSQVDSSITRKFGGTGLGLAISSKLVNLMGGKLSVESEFGKGTNFYFNILLGFSLEKQTKKADTEILKTTYSQNLKILVAEDNEINQKIAIKLFRKIGFEVVIANNGLEVLDQISKNHFDTIFMDMQMPELDGIEATKRIRLNPDYNRIKIIALTANAMSSDKELCLLVGMNDYISKPFKMEDLKLVLERVYA